MQILQEKITVVLGGTSGLGAATATMFAAEGATVVVAGRREPEGRRLADQLGGRCEFVRTDVTREDEVAALVAHAVDRFGRLDAVVNYAGEGGDATETVSTVDLDRLDATLAVHLKGTLAVMKYAAPPMVAQRSGSIVNVSSIGGYLAGWTAYGYSAVKAAVTHVSRCAAVELGAAGIRVNVISPGPIPTGIFAKGAGVDATTADSTAPLLAPLFASALVDHQSLPGAGQPEDVAGAALWLVSDASRFVTGQNIVVDGGISAGRPISVSQRERQLLATAMTAD